MIIGFGVKALSGKDTAAKHLMLEYGFWRRGFADPLKEACRVIFGLNDEQLYGKLKEVVDEYWGVTPRLILQKFGECLRKHYSEDIWVQALVRHIKTNTAANPGLNWVVSDVRHPNEAKALADMGGVLIRVDRPGAAASGGIENHPSEVSLDNFKGWDHVFDNSKDIDYLHQQIDAIMVKFNIQRSAR